MPIAPKPFKLVCPSCGYSKTVKPKSDTDILSITPIGLCPKCGTKMKKEEVDIFSEIWSKIWK